MRDHSNIKTKADFGFAKYFGFLFLHSDFNTRIARIYIKDDSHCSI